MPILRVSSLAAARDWLKTFETRQWVLVLVLKWQCVMEDLHRQPLGRKLGRKRRQESAESCRRLQVRETRETQKMPGKAGFLTACRLTQLGYGDLVVSADMPSICGETWLTDSLRSATISSCLSREVHLIRGF